MCSSPKHLTPGQSNCCHLTTCKEKSMAVRCLYMHILYFMFVFEHAPYSVCTFLCTSSGICGKLVSPLLSQSTKVSEVQKHGEHVCAVDVCKPASNTSSTGRVTDQPYPAGDTGGQRHITLLMNCSTHYGRKQLCSKIPDSVIPPL